MKKFIGYLVIVLLFAGSVCGITFGVMWSQNEKYIQDNSSTIEQVEELKEQIEGYQFDVERLTAQLNEALSQKEIDDNTIASLNVELKDTQDELSFVENELANALSRFEDINKQYDSLQDLLLETQTQLQNTITELETTTSQLDEALAQGELDQQTISSLTSQVASLSLQNENLSSQISVLESQLSSLQSQNEQLKDINENNQNTIASLNEQIEALQAQIVELTNQIQNSGSGTEDLLEQIEKLEQSIEYYESYIAQFETGELCVVTFEFNGSVYNVQILENGEFASVDNPISNDDIVFNGWTLDGEPVDISSYAITSSVTFVADVTYKYDVVFMVDNAEYDSQIIVENGYVTLPEEPTKTGYDFDGWSLDGINLVDNISTTAVTQNVTYQAVFTKLHTVTFMFEDSAVETQQVRNGEYAEDVSLDDIDNIIFYGWKNNDDIINISEYKIFADIIFVASYDKVGGTFEAITFNGLSSLSGQHIWTDGTNIYYSANGNYLFDSSSLSWSKIENWETGTGVYMWTDGSTYYCSYGRDQYVFDNDTNTWIEKDWKGLSNFYGSNIWTDGSDIYFSNYSQQYKLNKDTSTWITMSWNNRPAALNGDGIWEFNGNIYFSYNDQQYVLNKELLTWSEIIWNGFSTLDGRHVWTDGINAYYSYGVDQYVLNEQTSTWTKVVWNGISEFDGFYIWTDGTNIYYSKSSEQYKLIIE